MSGTNKYVFRQVTEDFMNCLRLDINSSIISIESNNLCCQSLTYTIVSDSYGVFWNSITMGKLRFLLNVSENYTILLITFYELMHSTVLSGLNSLLNSHFTVLPAMQCIIEFTKTYNHFKINKVLKSFVILNSNTQTILLFGSLYNLPS